MFQYHANSKTTRSRKCQSCDRRGASVVEFAIIAPVFFLMIIGFIEFGETLMVEQVLVNASRVGARQAITVGPTSSTVTSTVQEYASGVSVPGVAVVTAPDPATTDAGELITVTVSVATDDISWLPTPWFMGGKTLSAASTMRKEGLN